MKRLFTLGALICGFTASAQITVNYWDFLGPAEVVLMGLDEEPSIMHTPAGPNQTWDYGELNDYGSDSIAFAPAQWFDGHINFPEANYGSESEEGNIFLRKSSEGFDLMGLYGDLFETGENMAVKFNPYQRQIAFPMTYEQNWQNSSSFSFTIDDLSDFDEIGDLADSIVITITSHRTGNVDAWGTVNTPLGSFDALRMHVKDSTIQNFVVYAFGFPLFNESETFIEHSYSFVSNDPSTKYILVQYSFDPETELLSNVQWQMTEVVLATEDFVSVKTPEIYPNPAQDSFQISDLHTGDRITIISMSGQIVGNYKVSNKNAAYSIEGLAPGNYSVLIQGKKGVHAKKLSVQK